QYCTLRETPCTQCVIASCNNPLASILISSALGLQPLSMAGLSSSGRVNRLHILDRQLGPSSGSRGLGTSSHLKQQEVSLSAFSFLFSEMTQYFQSRIQTTPDLERKLEKAGYSIGQRVLELQSLRERKGMSQDRKTRIIKVVSWLSTNVWRSLFGKQADSIAKSTENENEYHIHDATPLTNTYVSVPRDMGSLNCASFVAGIIEGILAGAGFPATVTALFQEVAGACQQNTVYMVKFEPQVSIPSKHI
ncbi:unnamed protein product, partial [Chrysoparadoxa australica]